MKSAAKVGLLVIVFVALVIGSFSLLGRSLIPQRKKLFYVQMRDAGGLGPGSRVLMAGVEIGSVRTVGLADPHTAKLTLAINHDVKIPQGSYAEIPGALIGLGESILQIVAPPNSANSSPSLPDGSILIGNRGGPLDNILPGGGRDLYARLNGTLAGVQKILNDQRLQKDIKGLLETTNQTLKSSQATLARFAALAQRANLVVAENQGNLTAIVKGMKGTVEQVQFTASTLAKFLKQGKLQNGTTAMLDHAVKIENQASALLDKLNHIAGDPKLSENINRTVQNVADTTSKGPEIAANANRAAAGIATIVEEAKPLPITLNTVAEKASKLEDRLNALIDRVNGVKPPSTEGLKNLSFEMDLLRETNPGYWRTDVTANLPITGGFVDLGIYDAFESDRITAELGHYVNPKLDYRYGVYASKAALGVDYALSPRLSLRTDLWNINSPELDARLRYDFGGDIVGWIGADRIYDRTSPTIGIGIRK